MEKYLNSLNKWLISLGASPDIATYLSVFLYLVLVILLFILVNYILQKIFVRYISLLIKNSKNTFDDYLIKYKTLKYIAFVIPLLLLYNYLPIVFAGHELSITIATKLCLLLLIITIVKAINSVFSVLIDLSHYRPSLRNKPIKSYVQLINIFIYIFALILGVSIILNKSPLLLLSGLGALTAVILLVFKDTILGFVASIQITAHNMLKTGDWIELPDRGIDGEVLDITINTVKVQNWDKTISTVPTYSLVSESFKNWEGMSESSGRRIKRAINIDMTSIKFCDKQLLEKFKSIKYIETYINTKIQEHKEISNEDFINSHKLTNIGTFRAYIEEYLKAHKLINKNMTFIIRQLKPTANGLPLEIYVFSKDKQWANYERIQSDIFDHLLAIMPEFNLRVFQSPTGFDFRKI